MTKPTHRTLLTAIILSFPATSAVADHGRDFLLLQDAKIPSPLKGTVHSGFDWNEHDLSDEMGIETGTLTGLTDRIAAGVNLSFTDQGDGWKYASVTPQLLIDLTPEKSPVRIALSAGYEFGALDEAEHTRASGLMEHSHRRTKAAKKASKHSEQTTRSSPSHSHAGASPSAAPAAASVVQCGPQFGPDAPACDDTTPSDHDHSTHDHSSPTATREHSKASSHKQSEQSEHSEPTGTFADHDHSHDHSGIHRHGQSAFHARLILEADITEADKLVLNVINVTPTDGKAAWGYAAGLRHAVNHDLAVGVEATGDFGDANEHIVVAGGYFSPTHQLTLKFGVGFGLTKESPDATVRMGAVWRF